MKIAFISLGCSKNLINTQQMMALCRAAGHQVTGEPEGADVAVLNTCGFIDAAKSEAIEHIIALGELKRAGKLGRIAGIIPGQRNRQVIAQTAVHQIIFLTSRLQIQLFSPLQYFKN